MNFVTALFFKLFVLFIGIIPFKILYGFSDFVAFVLHRIFRYRVKIVYENLRRSFPDKSNEEIRRIEGKTYQNLADITVEGLKAFTMSTDTLLKRFRIKNPEVLDAYQEQSQSVMLLAAHYGNWEWGVITASLQVKKNLIGLYKPLANKFINSYLRKTREREGILLASIFQTAQYFKNYVHKGVVFVLIADQSPSNITKSYWVDFFGRETAFLHGPENYARQYELPVFFVEVTRIKRGYYEYELQPLVHHPNTLQKGEITRRYAEKLEAMIRKKPEDWLWSHRRWKHVNM